MEDKALRGIPWTALGYAVGKLLTVGATLVLAHLLAPSDFGLVALALVTIESVSYLTGVGLGPALIVRQDLDRQGIATGLTLMVGLGALSAVLLISAAPAAAALFGEPELAAVLAALAALLPLVSLASFYATMMQRELEFRRRFIAQMAQAGTYATAAVGLAALGAGVWSLVGGQVAANLAHLWAVVRLAPVRVRPAFDLGAARGLCATGTGFMMQSTASFLQHNVDYFVIGRLLGARPLGTYTMAFRLSELPYHAIADPVAQVAFPGVSRMRAGGQELRPVLLHALQVVAVASVPFGVVLAAGAEPFTRAVLGDRWLPMIGALSVLGVWGAVRPAQTMLSWFLNAAGHTRVLGMLSIASAVVLAPAVWLAAEGGGIAAVSWVVLGGLIGFLVALSVVVRRRLDVALAQQWRAVRAPALAGAAAWLAGRLAAEATGGLPAGAALMAATAAVFVAYAGAMAVVEPGLLGRTSRDLRRIVARARSAATEPDPSGGACSVVHRPSTTSRSRP